MLYQYIVISEVMGIMKCAYWSSICCPFAADYRTTWLLIVELHLRIKYPPGVLPPSRRWVMSPPFIRAHVVPSRRNGNRSLSKWLKLPRSIKCVYQEPL